MKTLRTLLELSINEKALISGFTTKLSTEYLTRLRELGFHEGELVKCLKTPPMGAPRVFEVCGSVFSMESEIAREIELKHLL
jgi:Fe2+ transport system protein FeoA